MTYRFAFGRPPAVAADGMVATSQPLATRAGLRMLERGGNAADAALAAAAVLCVTEPMSTGIGGDLFAAVWAGGSVEALDAAGPAPSRADPLTPVEERGPRSVTVPGAVAGWEELARLHGRLGLDACLADAIDVAERGFAVGERTAAWWSEAIEPGAKRASAHVPPEFSPPPARGERVRFPDLAATLRAVAREGASALYQGAVAEAICAVSWLDEDDLAGFRARWVTPLRTRYRDYEVVELPPPTQGVMALEALGLLDAFEPDLQHQVECVRLALEDARIYVRDGADVVHLLEPSYLARRRAERARAGAEPGGGTVYLCAVDSERMAVSLIQSLGGTFGSGLVAPRTGIVLQGRGAGFALHGAVVPGARPYHTTIPGLLLHDGNLVGPFGVTGGFIQAQAHVQLVSALVDRRLDPQAALDRSRFRVEGELIRLEQGLWPEAERLERLGYRVVREENTLCFGAGHAIVVDGGALLGGSDPRKDGYAAGL